MKQKFVFFSIRKRSYLYMQVYCLVNHHLAEYDIAHLHMDISKIPISSHSNGTFSESYT